MFSKFHLLPELGPYLENGCLGSCWGTKFYLHTSDGLIQYDMSLFHNSYRYQPIINNIRPRINNLQKSWTHIFHTIQQI